MSEKKIDKWLYQFTIYKEIEVDQEEPSTIDGQEVKIKRKVKEKVPVSFALKRPNRRMYENADLFYGVKLSEGIRAGLLTKALLLKRYRNDGGALSDADTQYFLELSAKLNQLESDHQRLLINVDKTSEEERSKKLEEVVKQKMGVLQALQSLETVNQAIFAHTAESKAQIHLNNWWMVFLAYWDEKNTGEFVEFFPGDAYETKMERWDVLDEEREQYVVEALARLSLAIGLWNAGAQTKEEFEQGERDYGAVITSSPEPASEEKPQEQASVPTPPTKKAKTKTPAAAPESTG